MLRYVAAILVTCGLRDYGTAEWEGGDEGCDHSDEKQVARNLNHSASEQRQGRTADAGKLRDGVGGVQTICGQCGARRIDSQLGLEPTPEAYIENMVAVFREVRRVLRDDGTLWINLAGSYASGGISVSQSPLRRRVPACDSGDIEFQCSQVDGRACRGSDDEPQAENRTRHADTARNGQSVEPNGPQTSPTGGGSGFGDCDRVAAADVPHDAQASTTPQSCDPPSDACDPSETASVSPSSQPTSSHSSQGSVRNSVGTSDTSSTLPPLVVRTAGKESFYSACGRSDCQGVGRCGFCFCSLAMPALNIKAKDEVDTPALLMLALQADGWIKRSTIIWAKPNPMPESCTDRPTKAHEYVFLLTKAARYFYDGDAVREAWTSPASGKMAIGPKALDGDWQGQSGKSTNIMRDNSSGRNARNVWTINPASFGMEM
jgi:hypothetical protein